MRDGEIFRLHWFTPAAEVDFCGHATLATAFVIFNYCEKNLPVIEFETLSGKFFVERKENLFEMNLPAYVPKKIPVTPAMSDAVNAEVLEAYLARYFPEDPVTGSTHCLIAPYWSARLGVKKIIARQASARGGILYCEIVGERVKISGSAVLFAESKIAKKIPQRICRSEKCHQRINF